MSNFPGATQYPVRWFGYPVSGSPRSIKPTVLLVIHITGNSNLPSAIGEATYSNRDGSGASFTFVTNRDGSIVQCLQPETQTPWTNGDIMSPNTAIPTVKAMVGSAHNPNEFCFMTCENVGYEPSGNGITAAQKETLARLAAWGSKISGLPINRNTVLGHKDINSVTRANCPTSGDINTFIGGIVTRANQILGGLPDTAAGDNMATYAEIHLNVNPLRTISFPATPVTIWSALKPGSATKQFTGPSSAGSDKLAEVTQDPAGAPSGWYVHIANGTFAGQWVRLVDITLDKDAAPAAPDCTAAIAAAVAPLKTKIANAKTALG